MIGYLREKSKIFTRSKSWNKVRKQRVRETPYCECCNKKRNLQVHHIKDFSTYPELELEPMNLIVLCGTCHLLIGHLRYWKSVNPSVLEDSIYIRNKILNRR